MTSDDPDHLSDLLDDLSEGRPIRPWNVLGTVTHNRIKDSSVYYGAADTVDLRNIGYDQLLAKETTVVVVNDVDNEFPQARDCGALTPPISYLQDHLKELMSHQQASKFGRYFAGMSLKDTIETIMLTEARDGALSGVGINETKSYLGAGLSGLEALDTAQTDYVAPEWAVDWLQVEAVLLDKPKYRELWPKGFMLHGPTGTGKTELSRYIARNLKWPLYRLDLGGLYDRWQGQSEANLRKALNFISSQGESVLLLDEAEKLFGEESKGQASQSTLLSMLLWWLQGESNRTVTVMTANNIEIIPPELYRPGRLDAVHKMSGLTNIIELRDFSNQIAKRLAKKFGLDPEQLATTTRDDLNLPVSQATVVAKARAVAKRMIIEGE